MRAHVRPSDRFSGSASPALALPNVDLIAPAPALQLTVAAPFPLIHQQLNDSNTSTVFLRNVLPEKYLVTKALATMAQ
jgi:hypothetical protein